MAKDQKVIERLLSFPTDFSWEELTKLLRYFGYLELKKGKTGGSRRKFANADKHIIILHKPHPGNILKRYQLEQVIHALKEKGYIKDE
jgi:hypothetical protein